MEDVSVESEFPRRADGDAGSVPAYHTGGSGRSQSGVQDDVRSPGVPLPPNLEDVIYGVYTRLRLGVRSSSS